MATGELALFEPTPVKLKYRHMIGVGNYQRAKRRFTLSSRCVAAVAQQANFTGVIHRFGTWLASERRCHLQAKLLAKANVGCGHVGFMPHPTANVTLIVRRQKK